METQVAVPSTHGFESGQDRSRLSDQWGPRGVTCLTQISCTGFLEIPRDSARLLDEFKTLGAPGEMQFQSPRETSTLVPIITGVLSFEISATMYTQGSLHSRWKQLMFLTETVHAFCIIRTSIFQPEARLFLFSTSCEAQHPSCCS